MAAQDNTDRFPIVEVANQMDPDGSTGAIAEILTEQNEMLKDAPILEANQPFSHKIRRRFSLPSGTVRDIDEGVDNEIATTQVAYEKIMMLETYAEADKVSINSFSDPKRARMNNAAAFMEGMNQTMQQAMLYHDAAVNPKQMTGFFPRLANASLPNVHNFGGSGSDTTSLLIVQWGDFKCHLIHPKAHPTMGIEHEDLGQKTLRDGNNKKYEGYRDHFSVHIGLAVWDYRCIARGVNIEATGDTNNLDPKKLIGLLNKMPMRGRGAVIYCNSTLLTQFEEAAYDKTNAFYMPKVVFGEEITTFRGHPIRMCDEILDTETAI